jgi:hypothetical protein
MTTGHLLTAVLADADSQASRALGALGVTQEALVAALSEVDVAGTTDAVPGPVVEIRVGDVTTTIQDQDMAAVLRDLTSDEVIAALRRALAFRHEQRATGSDG